MHNSLGIIKYTLSHPNYLYRFQSSMKDEVGLHQAYLHKSMLVMYVINFQIESLNRTIVNSCKFQAQKIKRK